MLNINNVTLHSQLFLGTAQYPSIAILKEAIIKSKTEVITVSLRRHKSKENGFWNLIKTLPCHILPNTAGCFTAEEAIETARMAQEIFKTNWIKLEIIGDDYSLYPNCIELIKATKKLVSLGFEVFPYCSDDLVICQKLIDNGCKILMPFASPIGSGLGLNNPYALSILRERFHQHTLIIDAGIGRPSDATKAMELGYDAVLLNTAVSQSPDPINMAWAFSKSIEAGRIAYQSGIIHKSDYAKNSTPVIDKPFWLQQESYYE